MHSIHRTAPAERTEDRRVPDLARRYVQRAHLRFELLGVIDQRQEIGQRDQLAVVEPAADEARVVVASLLAIRHHVHAGPKLRGDCEARRVLGSGLERLVR
jgi:hypothetical protein